MKSGAGELLLWSVGPRLPKRERQREGKGGLLVSGVVGLVTGWRGN